LGIPTFELNYPDPEAVVGLWRLAWRYLTAPYRVVAPDGIAELMLVATVATLAAVLSRYYGLRRYVLLAALALWAFLCLSLILYWLGSPVA